MAKRIFSLTAVCLLGFMLLPAGNKSTQTLSAPDVPAREATSGEVPDERLLFPELTDSDISEIHIRAGDDCVFDFSVRGELSVNGQKADSAVQRRSTSSLRSMGEIRHCSRPRVQRPHRQS